MVSLSSDSPVMSFDENKLMIINYDPRLINFVEEVRLLSSMGFKMAPQIMRNSKLAEDFMQQAKSLEEVIKGEILKLYILFAHCLHVACTDCDLSQQYWWQHDALPETSDVGSGNWTLCFGAGTKCRHLGASRKCQQLHPSTPAGCSKANRPKSATHHVPWKNSRKGTYLIVFPSLLLKQANAIECHRF